MSEHALAERLYRSVVGTLTDSPDRKPVSTYRLQLHQGFTFRDVNSIVDYLQELGIGDVYLSPYLYARPGSTHGYDVFDHSQINPEIGTEDDHRKLVAALAEKGLGRVLDIVPNHMGVNGPNRYWQDVLELGPDSPCAAFFDIDWHPVKEELSGRLLLPILEDQYGVVLESGKLVLVREGGSFSIHYYDRVLPVSPKSSRLILGEASRQLAKKFEQDDPHVLELLSIWASAEALPNRASSQLLDISHWLREQKVIPRRIARLCEESPEMREVIDLAVAGFRGVPGKPETFDRLHALLEDQVYRLSSWRVAAQEINYRRFFDINDLAGLRIEDPRVFEIIHERVFEWIDDGGVSGLRVDHPDGLADPSEYFHRLQESILLRKCRKRFRDEGHDPKDWFETSVYLSRQIRSLLRDSGSPIARSFPVVAEKILSCDESLPSNWPIDGTVGYEYLNALNGLFINPDAESEIDRIYAEFTGDREPFSDVLYHSKLRIAQESLASEINALSRQLNRVTEHDRRSRDFTHNDLRRAILEVIACFPVYRTYLQPGEPVSGRDRRLIELAVAQARKRASSLDPSLFDFLQSTLLLEPLPFANDGSLSLRDVFTRRFQQTTGPIQAKGLEDTAFYRQVPLLSRNEVGGDPFRFGLTPAEFHRTNEDRRIRWPGTLSTTATHDTKRGEDARIRINVLSEIPGDWEAALRRWAALNSASRVDLGDQHAPDPREEYLLYQTLIGAWPVRGDSTEPSEEFTHRIHQYMSKSLREAKVNTSWNDPDNSYRAAVNRFVSQILSGPSSQRFLKDFDEFARRIARVGVVHSLSQVVLKVASPGVPDIYQGCEFWDLNLVDPDNRRSVDYECRRKSLLDFEQQLSSGTSRATLARKLFERPEDGRIKQYVLSTALRHHRENNSLYRGGEYDGLNAEGERSEKIVSLARSEGVKTTLAVATRFAADLMGKDATLAPLGPEIWGDTRLILPEQISARRFRDLLTDQTFDISQDSSRSLRIGDILNILPVAWLVAES